MNRRTYQVGDSVTVYEAMYGVLPRDQRCATDLTVTKVSKGYIEVSDGRRFTVRNGKEYGQSFDMWAAYIPTW